MEKELLNKQNFVNVLQSAVAPSYCAPMTEYEVLMKEIAELKKTIVSHRNETEKMGKDGHIVLIFLFALLISTLVIVILTYAIVSK